MLNVLLTYPASSLAISQVLAIQYHFPFSLCGVLCMLTSQGLCTCYFYVLNSLFLSLLPPYDVI